VKRTALVVVDMLNTYEHADADALMRSVREVLPNIASLIERARSQDVGVVYVNDNYGAWDIGPSDIVERALAGPHPDLIEPIVPPDDVTAFVLKARHTIFYQTPLEYLLRQTLGVERLVLAGQVTEQCILYSALDAYVRHFDVTVPPDAVAAIHPQLHEAALEMMRTNMDADLTPAREIRLS
jgi:nicotinamidase-related amidase